MKKNNKKGFTIVELVIVIAVIAILAAVLIPTFSSVIKKAKVNNDIQLVRNLNTALATENKKHATMQSALDSAAEFGYDIDKINASATDNEILWDSVNDCFVYKTESGIEYIPNSKKTDEEVKDYQFWQIADELPATQTYSIYAGTGWTAETVDITVGFDAGKNKGITAIKYENTTGTAQEVVIRTNSASTTLTIDAFESGTYGGQNYTCDTIKHYDIVGKLVATNAGMSSYHENGKACFVEVQKGKIVAENQSEITVLHAKTVNVAVVENGGEIKGAYATTDDINTANTANGGNKTLVVTTDQEIQNKGNAAKDEAVENEMADNVLKDNIDAIAYIKDGNDITTYNTLEAAVNAVAEEVATTTINICKDYVLADTLEIKNKNINFVGKGATKPVLTGTIKITHDSGNHTVLFDNLKFVNTDKNLSNISDKTVCTSENDVNILKIQNCAFDYQGTEKSELCSVALIPTDKVIGTQLVFKGNIVENTAKCNVAISTRMASFNGNVFSTGNQTIVSYKKHVVDGNKFLGTNGKTIGYGFVGNYAVITNNTFENLASRAFQLVGSPASGSVPCQFDVTIKNNTFKNLGQLFKSYDLDQIYSEAVFNFYIAGSNDSEPNIFVNVGNIGNADSSATSCQTNLVALWKDKTWTGIVEPKLIVVMDKIEFDFSGELETGYITLGDGKQVITYTQAVNPSDGRRTGYYLTDNAGNKYWYFCTFNGNINYLLRDGTNDVYVAILGGGGNCTALQIRTLKTEPDWVKDNNVNGSATQYQYKYYDGKDHRKDTTKVITGAIYKSSFTIETFDGNTVYNGHPKTNGNKITIEETKSSSDINLFFSTIGAYSKLLVTDNSNATADNNTLIVVVSGAIGQLVVNGIYPVEVDASIANMNVLNKQYITVNAGKKVGTILVIGENACGTSIFNNGTINTINAYARVNVANNANATIGIIRIGETTPGGVDRRRETYRLSSGSIITNGGQINAISAGGRITLTNDVGGNIDSLVLGSVELNLADENGRPYAEDSLITNNGTMCVNDGKDNNITLNVKCIFINNGTIGNANRASSANAEGGMIYIGYRWACVHSGLVFTNSGTIHKGARMNGTAHQIMTFWFYGNENDSSKSVPNVTINSVSEEVKGTSIYSGTTNVDWNECK